MPEAKSSAFKPAGFIDRILARTLDLLLIGTVFAVMLVPIPLFLASERYVLGMGGDNIDELGLFFAVAALAALGTELHPLNRKHLLTGNAVTFGKDLMDIGLRLAKDPAKPAPLKRAVGRYLASVATCCLVIGLTYAVTDVMSLEVTLRWLAAMVAATTALVWLSVLATALVRADRRGWHDMLAGTMLVQASALPPERAPDEHIDDGSNAWDGDAEND